MAGRKKVAKKASSKKVPSKNSAKVPTTQPVEREAKEEGGKDRDTGLSKVLDAWAAPFNAGGRTVVARANQVKGITDLKYPSGIMALDIDCGGGLPANRLHVISGPPQGGKSFLCIKYMAMCQRLYGAKSVLGYVAIEPFDFKRAIKCGLVIEVPDNVLNEWDYERELVGLPKYTADERKWFKRQVGEFLLMRGETGEETMNVVLEAVRSNHFNLVCVDSLNIMLPAHDSEKDVGDTPARAGNALLLTDFAKKYLPLTNALDEVRRTAVIGIMQVRANADKATAGHLAKYMKDWAEEGAWALRHTKSIDVQVWNGSKIKKSVNGQDTVVGKTLNWAIAKGKDGTHEGKQGDVPFYFEEYYTPGTDDLGSVVTEGIRRGVFRPGQKGLEIIHPTTTELLDTVQSPQFLTKLMAADFEYELEMRRLVLHAAGISCLYRPM